MASKLTEKIYGLLKNNFLDVKEIDNVNLNGALRLLAKWRSILIQNTLISRENTKIHRGPFSGMEFLSESSEGCHVAKLIGTYEQPLHLYIDTLTKTPYEKVINIGCAEGYYAVGLALRMQNTKIFAYDTNLKAQDACVELAKKNGVSDRVSVFGELKPEDFTPALLENSIIFCDIEGAEINLLNPEIAPALQDVDIIVESHECLVPGITKALKDRFEKTHDVQELADDGMRGIENPPKWFYELSHLDQLLATWEWRSGPTPWLVMQKKGKS